MRAPGWIALSLVALTASGCATEEVPHARVTVRLVVPRTHMARYDVRVRVWQDRYTELVRDCVVPVVFTGDETSTVLDVPVYAIDPDDPGEFSIAAELFVGGEATPAAWQRAIIAFVRDEQRSVEIVLDAPCAGLVCRDDQTCVGDACVDACFAPNDNDAFFTRVSCDDPALSCLRGPARLLQDEDGFRPGGEEFCTGDNVCFCNDPPGCIQLGAVGCCNTEPVCTGPSPVCTYRQRRDGSCPATERACPGLDRCVPVDAPAGCCGGGVAPTCFGD